MVLMVALGGAGLAVAFSDESQQLAWQTIVAVGGATVAIFATVLLVFRLIDVSRYNRLRRGEGVLATWTVSPAQWRKFQTSSRNWDEARTTGLNTVDVSQRDNGEGMFIAVSDNALLVGGDFHSIEKNAVVRIHDDWMEFDTFHAGIEATRSRHVFHRFPIGPDAQRVARDVANHYRRVHKKAAASPKIRIYVTVVLIGLPLVVGLIGWWLNAE